MGPQTLPDKDGNRTIRTLKAQEAFCTALSAGTSVAAAARSAGISRTAAYEWKAKDPEFAKAWEEAYEIATDAMEDEAHMRAMNKSDALLSMFLKARRPEKYRDNRHHAGQVAIMQMTKSTIFEDD